MQRRIVLTAGLIVFSAIFAQCQTSNQSTAPVPADEPFGGPIISTPTATFYTPPPTAGISDVGRAGISSENTSIIPPGATVVPTGGTTGGTISSGISSTEPVSPAGSVETGPANDLGPSVFVGEKPVGTAGGVSLAEISKRFKAEKGAQTERVLSNEDVQKMLSRNGGVTMAKNMPPLGTGTLEQSGQQPNAGTQPASQSVPQNNASTNQPGTSAQTGTQSASGASQNQPASGASANNATTPQIQNQQANDAQGSGRLPATSTFLPLIGLLGLASGAIGLLFRKFRK